MMKHRAAGLFPGTPTDLFDKCSVLLFEAEADFRRHTRALLSDLGFSRIIDTGDFASFRSALAKGGFDLVIGDAGNGRGNTCDLVRQARHNAIGRDPFLGIILTTSVAGPENVRRAINSGTDHLLVKPYAPNHVLERIQAIVDHRKPFVVTLDYIGPDRRKGPPRAPPPELVVVPNALRSKVRNDPTALATPGAVRLTMERINRLKVQRYDLEIGVLVELLKSGGERHDQRLAKIGRLLDMLRKTVPLTEFAHAEAMCLSLAGEVQDMAATTGSLAPAELERLEETSMALHLCFHPEKTVSAITDEIADAVARAAERAVGRTAAALDAAS